MNYKKRKVNYIISELIDFRAEFKHVRKRGSSGGGRRERRQKT